MLVRLTYFWKGINMIFVFLWVKINLMAVILDLILTGFGYCASRLLQELRIWIDWWIKQAYNNKLGKHCLECDLAYGSSKNLVVRTQTYKVLREINFDVANDATVDG